MGDQMAAQIVTETSMVFGVAFPGSECGDCREYNGRCYVKTGDLRSCHKCDAQTSWMSVIFELPICLTGCADALWDDYFYAVEFVGGVSVGFDES